MALILTRSPYFVSRVGLYDESASLKLEIGNFDVGDVGFDVDKTYNLAFRNSRTIDVSPLIRDYVGSLYQTFNLVKYVRITISGNGVNGSPTSDTVTEFFVSDGYLYSTDSYNFDVSSELKEKCWLANSTDLVYKIDDSDLRLSFFQPKPKLLSGGDIAYENVYATFYNKGKVVETASLSNIFSFGESLGSFYIYSTRGVGGSSFLNRVEKEGGIYENNKCLEDFFEDFKLEEYDEIVLTNDSGFSKKIKVNTIEECKYNPYRVTFTNRYGMPEDLWFFKRSDKNISINKELFRGNSIDRYSSGNGVKTMQHFNVNGYEKITLNSGFVEEEMNEAFRQLLLSEEITLYDYKENKEYNVNIATSELQYKQHVNDKLINYTIEFEFAHEVINNVG